MAEKIKLTEADYRAINEALEGLAEYNRYCGYDNFEIDGDKIVLENGMKLLVDGHISSESTCTDRGDRYTPPSYRDDVSISIEYIRAYDAEGNDYETDFSVWKVKTDFVYD